MGGTKISESEHDVDVCEHVHVYFHRLNDMSSVKIHWMQCSVVALAMLCCGTCHYASLEAWIQNRIISKHDHKSSIELRVGCWDDVHWMDFPQVPNESALFGFDMFIVNSNVVWHHHRHVIKHYILHVPLYVKIYHVPWEYSYMSRNIRCGDKLERFDFTRDKSSPWGFINQIHKTLLPHSIFLSMGRIGLTVMHRALTPGYWWHDSRWLWSPLVP